MEFLVIVSAVWLNQIGINLPTSVLVLVRLFLVSDGQWYDSFLIAVHRKENNFASTVHIVLPLINF